MALDRKRTTLILGSILIHGAVAFGVFVSGIWHLDQLDPGRQTTSLAVLEPPAPQGSPAAAREMPKIVPKHQKEIPKVIVQPVIIDTRPDVTATETTSTTAGNGLGSGSGSGDNPDGPADGTGHCVGVGCAPAPTPPKIVIEDPCVASPASCQPKVLPPKLLSGLRYAGDTNLVPNDAVKQQMMRDDHKRSVGTFRVCLDAAGAISSITQQGTTGFPSYDQTLASAIAGWRYHPYQVGAKGIPACGVVTFVYSIR